MISIDKRLETKVDFSRYLVSCLIHNFGFKNQELKTQCIQCLKEYLQTYVEVISDTPSTSVR